MSCGFSGANPLWLDLLHPWSHPLTFVGVLVGIFTFVHESVPLSPDTEVLLEITSSLHFQPVALCWTSFLSITYCCCWACWYHLTLHALPQGWLNPHCDKVDRLSCSCQRLLCENSSFYFILFFTYSSVPNVQYPENKWDSGTVLSSKPPFTLMTETINLGKVCPDSLSLRSSTPVGFLFPHANRLLVVLPPSLIPYSRLAQKAPNPRNKLSLGSNQYLYSSLTWKVRH